MEALFDSHTLTNWLLQYGALALFFLLSLGIIALPVPEETLMVLSGILMHGKKLTIVSALIGSYLGVLCGISVSYLLGRTAGHYLIPKYGKWIRLTPANLRKVHRWFDRFGKWTLFIGYFIPGVRHFTGFVAGTTLGYRQFAIFAYGGAILWVSLFLSIGYFFGNKWLALFARYKEIEIGFDWLTLGIIAAIVALIGYAFYKGHKGRRRRE